MNKKKYLIISGGTGGHVIPAVNFGNYIVDNGHKCLLILDNRGKKFAKTFNGSIKTINSSHLSGNFFRKLKSLLMLKIGFIQSLLSIIYFRPHFCISFGSYATFAPLLILIFFRFFGFTKIYLHEQNSIMGKVNIIFSPFVDKIFLNYYDTNKVKKNYSNKTFLVGIPSDHRIKFIYKEKNKGMDKIKIFLCGGSQSAFSLNNLILSLFNKFPKKIIDKIDFSIQCSELQKEKIKFELDKLFNYYEIKSFFNNFIEKLNDTDILISRAGAGTINDVILTKTPTIFIPLPSSADNHQYFNAFFLKEKKAAILIEQKDLESSDSMSKIIKFIENTNEQENIINNLKKIKTYDSNDLIFKNINE